MVKNYLSKIKVGFQVSANLKTFFKLIINSKKYSNVFKSDLIKEYADSTIEEQYNFCFNAQKHEISMRTYSGDIDIFYEIFWKQVYKIPQQYTANYKVIVDLGAHIGFTAIYFATQYPNSEIISVEASAKNYNLLQKNTSTFQNITLHHAAIFPTDGEVLFENADLSYNCKVGESGIQTQALSIDTLMKNHNLHHIDLLKIDIEGAEKYLLSENCTWLYKVDQIIIEIHDDYKIEDLKRDLKPYNFEIFEPSDSYFKNIFAKRIS